MLADFYNAEFISQVALNCNDIGYSEFESFIYGQAVFEAERSIARDYNILEKWISGTVDSDDVVKEFIEMPVKNFRSEIVFKVNGIAYTKVNTIPETEESEYYIKVLKGDYVFDYSDKVSGDEIYIEYIADAIVNDYRTIEDGFSVLPLLPTKYDEEVVKRATVKMTQWGIAKFKGETKQKYADLYQIYGSQVGYDTKLARNDAWVTIKPFQYP